MSVNGESSTDRTVLAALFDSTPLTRPELASHTGLSRPTISDAVRQCFPDAVPAQVTRVYNAVDTAESIHFNQIHAEDNGRVGYDKRCKKCDQVLEMSDIVKGYEYEPDHYVIFEKDDLDKLRLKSTKVIGGPPLLIDASVDAVKRWKFDDAKDETTQAVEFKYNN